MEETRLGVDIEDGLESIAARMESDDFKWIVMAIRIQREVGGNLAELLLSVAATIREQGVSTAAGEDALRRGPFVRGDPRGSAAGLPALSDAHELCHSVRPMFTSLLGWVMLGMMAGMMLIGAFWLSKVAKVEV